jgi:regulator of cell morphogenesis and NO signaling
MTEPASLYGRHAAPSDKVQSLRETASRQHVYLRRSSELILEEVIRLDETAAAQSTLANARDALADFVRQLQGHIAKEENILFPALQALAVAERDATPRPALPFPTVLHPVRLLEAEHVRLEAALDAARFSIQNTPPPDSQSDAWYRCAFALSQLASDLREHQRSENEVLFPLALELEARLP